jgi:hypothetical protein
VRRKRREKNIIFLSDGHVILQEVDDEEAEDAPKEDRESDINLKVIDEDNQREEQKKRTSRNEHRTMTLKD